MHEHIFVLTAEVQQNYPGERGSEDGRIADAVTRLGALAAQGVRTIVDPAVVGLGRNLPRIQRVAEQVPEVSAGGTHSSGTVIFAMRARHSARRPHRTGASACRTRAVTLLRQPDIVGDLEQSG